MATSKQTTKQGIARADELVITIGNLLLGDENVTGADWEAVSLVINLDGRRSLFGYLYDAAGNADPLVLEESDIIDLVEELRELMAAEGEPWKAVMVQFHDEELRFTFDSDGQSWRLDGDNTGAMVEALRPEALTAQPAKKPAKKKPAAAKKPAAKKAVTKKPAAKKASKKAPAKKKSR
ncbi:MAG: hypothetical protein ACOZQL_42900 [Myxococcota bacterium]